MCVLLTVNISIYIRCMFVCMFAASIGASAAVGFDSRLKFIYFHLFFFSLALFSVYVFEGRKLNVAIKTKRE